MITALYGSRAQAFLDPLKPLFWFSSSHAGSLLRQHPNFVAQQKSDHFVRSYMTWLAHHEFGLDHRPFRFDNKGAERLAAYQPDQLDYWLAIWCQSYAWLENSAPNGAVFVCYEDLCRDPDVWSRLRRYVKLRVETETMSLSSLAKRISIYPRRLSSLK